MYLVTLTDNDGRLSQHTFHTRENAEAALQKFARVRHLAVHLHPTDYSDSAVSTAYMQDGDPFFDMRATVRRIF